MTARQLRDFLNSVDDEMLDREIVAPNGATVFVDNGAFLSCKPLYVPMKIEKDMFLWNPKSCIVHELPTSKDAVTVLDGAWDAVFVLSPG